MRAREASEKSKDEDLLETNTGGTKKVYIEKSEARAKKTRTLEDEDEKSVDEEERRIEKVDQPHESSRIRQRQRQRRRRPCQENFVDRRKVRRRSIRTRQNEVD